MADWLSAAADLGGGILSFLGNQSGASASKQANDKALKEAEAARAAGVAKALPYLQTGIDAGDAADLNLQGTMGLDPNSLTPSQQIGLEDTLRIGQQNLAAGGLRGAGRAGQAVLNDAARRYKAGAVDTNQGRADAATSTLAGQGASARAGAANLEAGAGSADASDILNVGMGNAENAGNLPISQANLIGTTLGGISSFLQKRPTDKYGTGGGAVFP